MGEPAYETWYRGEGVGVPPGKPGGNLSDFGDGMYLTDQRKVAEIYAARRSASPDGRRVLEVSLARGSLGRVLDLSGDSRWHQFMNDTKDPKLLRKSRMHYLQIKHELYAQFFVEFLKRNKIDIRNFDAVIGPEYTTGGRQLCILHKNGQPSKLHQRVRALLRLITASPAQHQAATGDKPGTAPGPIKVSGVLGKVRIGVSMFSRVAARFGVSLLLGYLAAKLRERFDQKILDNELKSMEPAIDAQLAQYTMKALALASVGRPAYANIVVKVSYVVTTDVGDGTAVSTTSIPSAKLTSVYVSHTKPEGAGREESSSPFPYSATFYSYPLFISPPFTFSKEQVDQFRDAIAEMRWYEETLTNKLLHDSDVSRLKGEMQAKDAKMHEAYGPFPPAAIGKEKGYTGGYNMYWWFDDD